MGSYTQLPWLVNLKDPRLQPLLEIQVPNPDRSQGAWLHGASSKPAQIASGGNQWEYYLLYLSGHLKGRYGWPYRHQTQA